MIMKIKHLYINILVKVGWEWNRNREGHSKKREREGCRETKRWIGDANREMVKRECDVDKTKRQCDSGIGEANGKRDIVKKRERDVERKKTVWHRLGRQTVILII